MTKALNAVLAAARDRISGGYSAGRNMGSQQSTSLGKDPGVDYAPKPEDERKFVAAHTHIEQEYPTGMKDVFQGNPAKPSMDTPQMTHYGRKNNGEAEAAAFTVQKEDVEQIDELERKTLKSYAKKAATSQDRAGRKMDSEEDKAMSTDGNKYPEKQARHTANAAGHHKVWLKRHKGLAMAKKKLGEDVEELDEMWKASQNEKGEHILKHKSGKISSKSYPSKEEAIQAAVRKNRASGAFKEAVELMDDEDLELHEISKGLADRYSRKASKTNNHGTAVHTNDPKAFKKSMNRLNGVDRAERKIAGKARVNATEEVEPIDEISRSMASRYINKAEQDHRQTGKRRASIELALRKKWGSKEHGIKEPKVKATNEDTTDVKTNTAPTGPVGPAKAAGPVQPGTPVNEPLKNDKEKNKANATKNNAVKEELVNEISKAALGRYVTSAHASGSSARGKAERHFERGRSAKTDQDRHYHTKEADKNDKIDDKRNAGIHRATAKLTGTARVNAKEETQIDEFSIHLKHPGALTRKAKKAGESNSEFEHQHAHDKGLTGKQARFAINAKKWHHEEFDHVCESATDSTRCDTCFGPLYDISEELLEAGILCDKKSLGKKMKYHKGKMKNEDIGSTKYRHHLNQSNIIKKMMEGMEAVELDEKKQDDNFEYKRDKRGFIIKKRGYKKTDDKKKGMKEQTELIAYLASQLHRDRF